jgi:hypothetical protein
MTRYILSILLLITAVKIAVGQELLLFSEPLTEVFFADEELKVKEADQKKGKLLPDELTHNFFATEEIYTAGHKPISFYFLHRKGNGFSIRPFTPPDTI